MLRSERVAFTTNGDGDATVYSGPIRGYLHALRYVYGDAATGADFTITDDATGIALLTVTNAGTSSTTHMPRGATVTTANAAALYASGGTAVNDRIPIVGRVKLVVAEGGATKTGTLVVIWEES